MTDQRSASVDEPVWAAYVAIDWADQKHIWKMQTAEGCPIESGELEHTPEAVEVRATQLATRFSGRPIAIALEQSRGTVVFALTKYSHLHFYPIHPSTLAHFRQALVPSGAILAIPGYCSNFFCNTGLASGAYNQIPNKRGNCSF